MARAPAFRLAALVSAGALGAPLLETLLPSSSFFPILLVAVASLAVARRFLSPEVQSLGTVVICLLIGASKSSLDRETGLPALSAYDEDDRVILGRLDADPHRLAGGWRFRLTDVLIISDTSTRTVEGDVNVTFRTRHEALLNDLQAGDPVALLGRPLQPAGPRNPGEFDRRAWNEANGVVFDLYLRGDERLIAVDTTRRDGGVLHDLHVVRRSLLSHIDRCVGGEEGELLKGLLLGVRSGITPETNEAFIRSGVAHVLAVSGSNVAVVAGFIGTILLVIPAPKPVRNVLLGLGLLCYMILSGSQPPVVRATVMALVGLTCLTVQERLNPFNALGVSALILFGVDASVVRDVGFQLSFAAVLALLIGLPPMNRWIGKISPPTIRGKFAKFMFQCMAVSVVATLGTLPLTASAFGRVSLIGIFANLVVVPATAVSVILGGVAAIAEHVWPVVADIYGSANWAVLRFTIWFARLCARPDFAAINTPGFTWVYGITYLGFLGMVVPAGHPGRRRASLLVFLSGLALTAVVDTGPVRPAEASLRCAVIDVGQGDAILFQTPLGKNVLIDAGPAALPHRSDQSHLLPFLRRSGIDRIHLLLVTHGHDDHAGGLPSLIRDVAVDRVVSSPTVAPVLMGILGRDVSAVGCGDVLEADSTLRMFVLSPPAGLLPTNDSLGNDASLVVKVVYGAVSFLLTGDATIRMEYSIAERFGSLLHSTVLKVGHHGSHGSSSREFIRTVRPRVSLIPVGVGNRFGHPSRETIARLRDVGSEIFRTDREGAIMVETDGRILRRVAWHANIVERAILASADSVGYH